MNNVNLTAQNAGKAHEDSDTTVVIAIVPFKCIIGGGVTSTFVFLLATIT